VTATQHAAPSSVGTCELIAPRIPLVDELLDALEHDVLADAQFLRHRRVGTLDDREGALHLIEQALVECVERDRGAELARADLGCRGQSHRAASFAW
jgi:hypothetical protein